MKLISANICTVLVLTCGLLFTNPASANEDVIKMVLKTQSLSAHQAELAFNAVMAIKVFGERVKHNKENAQSYLLSLIENDEMDVEYMMDVYRQWQRQSNVELEDTLNALATLHRDLTVEQRKALFQTLHSLTQ